MRGIECVREFENWAAGPRIPCLAEAEPGSDERGAVLGHVEALEKKPNTETERVAALSGRWRLVFLTSESSWAARSRSTRRHAGHQRGKAHGDESGWVGLNWCGPRSSRATRADGNVIFDDRDWRLKLPAPKSARGVRRRRASTTRRGSRGDEGTISFVKRGDGSKKNVRRRAAHGCFDALRLDFRSVLRAHLTPLRAVCQSKGGSSCLSRLKGRSSGRGTGSLRVIKHPSSRWLEHARGIWSWPSFDVPSRISSSHSRASAQAVAD